MAVDVRPAPPAAAREVTPPGRRRWRVRLSRLDVTLSPYLYISPFYLLFAVFGLFPLGYTFWVSLNHWEIIGGHQFIGLRNYARPLRGDQFLKAGGHTFPVFVIATVPQPLAARLGAPP